MGFSHCDQDSCGRPYLRCKSSDGRHFILTDDIYFTNKAGVCFVAPTGGTTDGASTPPAIWTSALQEFLPPFGIYWPAAFFHDGAYQNWLLIRNPDGSARSANLTKPESDALLLEIMTYLGVDPIVRDAIYNGVKFGGAWSFAEDRKK